MIRQFIKNGQSLAFLSFFGKSENPHDNVLIDKHNIFQENPDLTGFQRLRNLFKPYLDCPVHPRIIDLCQTSLATFILGGIYGGITNSRITFIKFIETNEATQFRSHLDAKRKLSDKMFLSFMKGFTRWGMRVSFFCTTFMTTYTVLSVYKNNDSIFYYTLSGLCAGGLYKFPLGPKGIISGSFFGAAFGSIFGGIKFIEYLLTNTTEEEKRRYRFEMHAKATEDLSSTLYNAGFEDTKKEIQQLAKSF